MSSIDSFEGKLLVAPAAMIDANFVDAVTLVLAHNEEGAFGLVLDRRIDGAVELEGEWAPLFDGSLWEGGPCDQDRLIPLVRVAPGRSPSNVHVMTDKFGGLGFVDVRPEAGAGEAGDFSALRLFIGYAGWAPGQLDAEVAMGAWVVTDAEFDDPFATDFAAMRGRILRRLHARESAHSRAGQSGTGAGRRLSTFPDDVTAN